MKVKTKVVFDIEKDIEKINTPQAMKEVGELVVREMKTMILSGVSPVRGNKRFAPYKDRTKYPGDLKPARPVNLKLTGEMLDALTFRPYKETVHIGIFTSDQGVKDRAEAHNQGTEHMAKRQFIPQEGEEFAVTIMRKIKAHFEKKLSVIIRQSNKSK